MSQIIYTKTKWSDVQRVMETIVNAVEGEEDSAVIMGCLALAVSSQLENYNLQQVKDGIKGASEWIALYASSLDPNSTVKAN